MTAGDAYAALGYLAAGLFLALAAACAVAILRRPRHVPGLPGDGKGCMTDEEFIDFLVIVLKEDETAPEPERTP